MLKGISKLSLISKLTLIAVTLPTIVSTLTLSSLLPAYAGAPLRGRVIDITECTEKSGVLKGHYIAVAKVYNSTTSRAPSTFVVYSTHPAHGLDRPDFLKLARDSKSNDENLNFYWSQEKGSNISGVQGRYHFVRSVTKIR